MQMKAIYQITVRDAQGKIIKKTRKRLCRSFVLQFLQLLQAYGQHVWGIVGAGVSILNTANAAQTVNSSGAASKYFCFNALAAITDYGLIAGSLATAPTSTDYKIGTIIAHAGGVTYGATSVTAAAAVVGANVDMTIARSISNNSGGNITIREFALYVSSSNSGGGEQFFCILHDVTGDVVVADGQVATITLTFRTTV